MRPSAIGTVPQPPSGYATTRAWPLHQRLPSSVLPRYSGYGRLAGLQYFLGVRTRQRPFADFAKGL